MKKKAILLIGPTGSGKSPLGQTIEINGIQKNTFAHFDFGALLRQAATGEWACGMSPADLQKLNQILTSGALLENETFYLAERIISHFNACATADAVVLNGLPRHVAQAKDVAPWFDIRMIIRLECSAQTVFDRIRLNSGKDRTDRVDDGVELISKKLAIFESRTAPLCDWFSSLGIPVVRVSVEVETQPESIVQQIENEMPRFTL